VTSIYTIGYKGKSLAEFVGRLREASVDGVIDVRLRNTSHLAGYTKRDDLAFLLREGFAISYEHRPELAPSPEIMDAYREDGDWTVYQSEFLPLLRERSAEEVGREITARYRAPCLLCAEPTPDHCHRRLVAEYWAERLSGVVVVHL